MQTQGGWQHWQQEQPTHNSHTPSTIWRFVPRRVGRRWACVPATCKPKLTRQHQAPITFGVAQSIVKHNVPIYNHHQNVYEWNKNSHKSLMIGRQKKYLDFVQSVDRKIRDKLSTENCVRVKVKKKRWQCGVEKGDNNVRCVRTRMSWCTTYWLTNTLRHLHTQVLNVGCMCPSPVRPHTCTPPTTTLWDNSRTTDRHVPLGTPSCRFPDCRLDRTCWTRCESPFLALKHA